MSYPQKLMESAFHLYNKVEPAGFLVRVDGQSDRLFEHMEEVCAEVDMAKISHKKAQVVRILHEDITERAERLCAQSRIYSVQRMRKRAPSFPASPAREGMAKYTLRASLEGMQGGQRE